MNTIVAMNPRALVLKPVASSLAISLAEALQGSSLMFLSSFRHFASRPDVTLDDMMTIPTAVLQNFPSWQEQCKPWQTLARRNAERNK